MLYRLGSHVILGGRETGAAVLGSHRWALLRQEQMVVCPGNDCNPDGNLTVKYSEVERGSLASIGISKLQGNSLIEMDLPSVRRLRRRGLKLFTKQAISYSILVRVLCKSLPCLMLWYQNVLTITIKQWLDMTSVVVTKFSRFHIMLTFLWMTSLISVTNRNYKQNHLV